MAILARRNVFQADDMQRIKHNGVSTMVGNDDCPLRQKNELRARDGVFAATRSSHCKWAKSILKPHANALNIQGRTIPIRAGRVKPIAGRRGGAAPDTCFVG